MANLPESSLWETGIYQLEETDPVQGGPNGIDNQQGKQLANRTAYLKAQVELLGAGKQPLDATLTALAALNGVADRIAYFTGPDTVALTALSAFIRTLLDDADPSAARATLGAISQAQLDAAIASLVNSAPATLNTLNELSDALGNDANFATTITNAMALKASIQSVQKSESIVSAAGGTADAITGSYTPGITALTNGMTLYVRAGSANATTTPTFTPASGTIAAKTIVKGAGSALAAGDIAGGGHWIELRYDATLDKWVLINPATGVSMQNVKQLQSITATVAANALTLGINPTSLDFRSSALTNGVPNTRTVSASLSLVVPSTATLGTISATAARLALLALDNAGTVELAVVNLAGGINLDETTLISTTSISAAASAANVIYSTTARTNVPFRVVGFIDINEATAGTWATAPTTIQGTGGQALASMSSIGYGQTKQNMMGSRVPGTTYYNTTGRPIIVNISGYRNSVNIAYFQVNGVNECDITIANGTGDRFRVSSIIPPGAPYLLQALDTTTLSVWTETR